MAPSNIYTRKGVFLEGRHGVDLEDLDLHCMHHALGLRGNT